MFNTSIVPGNTLYLFKCLQEPETKNIEGVSLEGVQKYLQDAFN